MSVFRELPFDAVYHILSYDNRSVLKNGKIVTFVDKLDIRKYANVIELLLQKPKIQKYTNVTTAGIRWNLYRVTFSNNQVLEYHINYGGHINDIMRIHATSRCYNRRNIRLFDATTIP
uniref:Uncharacterized protein n=1 Tax=viral metagenome TaxID=1070528 RepID=A0A6C0DR93_9ZZZZ